MSDFKGLFGPNAGYVLDLYERYQRDPDSVDAQTRSFFQTWTPPAAPAPTEAPARPAARAAPAVERIVGAAALAEAIRERGHLATHLDPLGRKPPGDPALDLRTYGLTRADLAELPSSVVGGPAATWSRDALQAIRLLRQVYEGTVGFEFGHVTDAAERAWLREAVESGRYRERLDAAARRALLERLTAVEALERFLGRAFPGQKRFSIEGTDMLVPMLDDLVAAAAGKGVREINLGMAHRGRLNVLAHVVGKPYETILGEFHSPDHREGAAETESTDRGWTGDVKYHLGARRSYRQANVVQALVTLAPNPSHLEFVNPAVQGMTRAAQDDRGSRGMPRQDEDSALAILIHGDAAFPGEGIVAETLNLSRLPGYRTGGTIHIIVDNQIGFTTEPADDRSTLYASDLAKGFEIPIVHVNADDPEACLSVIRLARAYRQRFDKDFLINLVGYRRWGHNEGDDPVFTQPLMYAQIESHPTVRALWAEELARQGVVSKSDAEAMLQAALDRLEAVRQAAIATPPVVAAKPRRRAPGCCDTPVPAERLTALNEEMNRVREGFTPYPKLERLLQRRRLALGPDGTIDWAHAEELAFASILAGGTPVRLTGQDTERGTFTQRHLVLHDIKTGATHTPLAALPSARASFAVYNSPLSESAPLGFEYGYSVGAGEALVLWEAQFGDFANAAQVIVDQFISAGQSKWRQASGLVLLLPHGYEGQGPEHSSARLERFLQLVAAENLRIAVPTTSGQYFHLIRRQAELLKSDPRPLIVMTPKSLLRHPLASSRLSDLTAGGFRPVIDDEAGRTRADRVRRLVLCSGKVYVDLVAGLEAAKGSRAAETVAVVRLEELYPFPRPELADAIAGYPGLRELIWTQEEPMNQGAWGFVEWRLREILPPGVEPRYAGRPPWASPAEGSLDRHAAEQARIVETALGLARPSAARPRQVSKAG